MYKTTWGNLLQHHISSSAWCLMLKTMQLMIWWAKDGFSQTSPLSKVTPLSKEVVQDLLDSQVLHGDASKLGNTLMFASHWGFSVALRLVLHLGWRLKGFGFVQLLFMDSGEALRSVPGFATRLHGSRYLQWLLVFLTGLYRRQGWFTVLASCCREELVMFW